MSTAKAIHPINRSIKSTPQEEREGLKEIHSDIISALLSQEADAITPLMSKIYLTLVNAPSHYYEREGVLRFKSREKNGELISGWAQLVRLIDVESEIAHRALLWMHDEGIITYCRDDQGTDMRLIFELDELGRYILTTR